MNREQHNEQELLEALLVQLELKLAESYYQAGRTLLEYAENECRKINELVDEIIVVKKKLVQLQKEANSPSYGRGSYQDETYPRRSKK